MQFHLNGFQFGDPLHYAKADTGKNAQLPDHVDVLIVGCGPAGLTLAAQLSAFANIKTCIVERKAGALQLGQADGVACRTMEMFHAFGFSEKVLKEGYFVNEVTFWKPDETEADNIVRHGRVQDVEDGLSEFAHVILNQARIHDFYLDVMAKSSHALEPFYNVQFKALQVERPVDQRMTTDYPVTVQLQQTNSDNESVTQSIKARYVVGCDGARSAVRESIGRQLHGDSANQAWGVMDVLAVTDFPDIRLKAAVQSAKNGNLLVIPREGGYLVRIYVELDKLNTDERVSDRNIGIEQIVAAAQTIFHPYIFNVKKIEWWSVYEIGQRICDRYDDADPKTSTNVDPRVFIAGDACHTHSPKAGQGMNVSMQDAFNLGWKLGSVLNGHASPNLLATYTAERQPTAQELIDFDRKWARMFSDHPLHSDDESGDGIDPKAFQNYFVEHGRFTAGFGTHYRQSIITGDSTHQFLAKNLIIGTRFHSAPVVRLADALRMQLGHAAQADGRWRLYLFADNMDSGAEGSSVRSVCDFLQHNPASPLQRYTPADADCDAMIDVRAVFQQPHHELQLETMPPLLLPRKGLYRLIDYEKIFCAYRDSDENTGIEKQDIFERRGINREQGCAVIVRPDQYIAHILPLQATDSLVSFFNGILLPRQY